MHAALVQHLIAADPEYAFEAAVLGERGMREKYTHRQLHDMIYYAKRTAQINKAGNGGFNVPKGVGQLNVTLVGGGGGGGSGQVNVSNPYGGGGGGSSHAADALKYALPTLMLPPKP